MEIIEVSNEEKEQWNSFIEAHYPPIGAFMATWEWGEFQKALGREIGRYKVLEDGDPVAAFMLVYHALPLRLSYGYVPRGPVFARNHESEKEMLEVFAAIKEWARNTFPHLVFLRFEPPYKVLPSELKRYGFRIPRYYIQPRYNLAIPLEGSEEEIAKMFHPSTRSNLGRAEKRGVTVTVTPQITKEDYGKFDEMKRDTIARNSGTNAYPTHAYFQALLSTIPSTAHAKDRNTLSLLTFIGYQEGAPAGIHMALLFGDTATYLYGASFTKHLSSKVTTYLHWTAAKEAKRRGFKYYDIGGIDVKRWPSLTAFKRQFRGKEFEYMGNIDLPLRPMLYYGYNLLKKFK